jgi:tetratricopeptide (TPR) repeat protein
MHRNVRQFEIAIPLLEQNLERRKNLNGPHHADTLEVMEALVVAYRFARQEDKALQLALEILDLRTRHQGADHIATLISKNNLASLYLQLDQVGKALPLIEETLDAMRAKVEPLHPELLNVKRHLASAYHDAEQFDKSVPLQETVVEEFKTVYGPKDMVTQGSIDLLLAAYLDIGRCDKATALLPFIHGYDSDPSTQDNIGMQKRGKSLRDLIGKIKPSADKYQQVLAVKRENHSDSLAARQAFALVLRNWGRLTGAAYHLKAVLDARQTLGADRLEAHVCRMELGTTRLQQKRYAVAEPLLLEAYVSLKNNPKDANSRWTKTTVERLVQLYENSNRRDKADEWRKKLDDYKKR